MTMPLRNITKRNMASRRKRGSENIGAAQSLKLCAENIGARDRREPRLRLLCVVFDGLDYNQDLR